MDCWMWDLYGYVKTCTAVKLNKSSKEKKTWFKRVLWFKVFQVYIWSCEQYIYIFFALKITKFIQNNLFEWWCTILVENLIWCNHGEPVALHFLMFVDPSVFLNTAWGLICFDDSLAISMFQRDLVVSSALPEHSKVVLNGCWCKTSSVLVSLTDFRQAACHQFMSSMTAL